MLRVIGVVSTIAMRQVDSTRAVFVHYVWEPEERIPRCDIYDIHVIVGSLTVVLGGLLTVR